MAEADPQQRPPVGDRLASQRHRSVQSGGIAGPGREDHAVHVGRQHLHGRGGVGQDPHPRPPPPEAANDVHLEPEIQDRNQRAALGWVALVARVGRRDLGDEILVFPSRHGSGQRASLIGIGLAGRGHDGPQAAVRAEVSGQGSGVDAGDGRYPSLAQHRGQL